MFSTEAQVEIDGICASIHRLRYPKAVKVTWDRPVYTLRHIVSARQREYEIRWNLPGDSAAVATQFSMLPSRTPLTGEQPAGEFRCVEIEIDSDLFEQTAELDSGSIALFERTLHARSTEMEMLFECVVEAMSNAESVHAEICRHLTICLMIECGRVIREAETRSEDTLASWQIARAREILDDFTSERVDKKIPAIAARCGVSSRHLMRGFKASTGMTIHHYLNAARLEQTKKLLASTDMPLKKIAWQMGFASSSHMSIAFRKLTGLTPSSFREQNKG